LVIGAFVRGVSMRDLESLCEQAELGKLSTSTASRVCEKRRERYQAFNRRDLYDPRPVALFLDATFLAVRARSDRPRPRRADADRRRRRPPGSSRRSSRAGPP
jgi:transposase-like protein